MNGDIKFLYFLRSHLFEHPFSILILTINFIVCFSETPICSEHIAALLTTIRKSNPHSSFDMQTGRYYLEHSGNIKERV
jgi:hypothetical protein